MARSVLPTSEAGEPPAPRWGFGDVAITVGLAVFLGTLVASVSRRWIDSGGSAAAWSIVALLVVPWIALAGWPLYAAHAKGRGPRADYRLVLNGRGLLIGVVGGVVALVVATGVQNVTERVLGHPFDSTVGVLAQTVAVNRAALVVFALCAAFGAPVVEEIAFRGLLFGAFRRVGFPLAWSIVYTSLAFAVFHLELVRLPLLLTIGLVLTGVRALADSTGASIVAHMCVNLPGALGILQLTRPGR